MGTSMRKEGMITKCRVCMAVVLCYPILTSPRDDASLTGASVQDESIEGGLLTFPELGRGVLAEAGDETGGTSQTRTMGKQEDDDCLIILSAQPDPHHVGDPHPDGPGGPAGP